MKAILISDYAKWCALMMNGIKNIEVRKNKTLAIAIQKLINKYGYAEIYVYCTKGKPNLWLPYEYDCFELDETSQPYLSDKPILDVDTKMNGKVIFKFRCYKVEEINRYCTGRGISYKTETLNNIELCDKSCLDLIEIDHYLYFKKGYAIHISKLEIFDKPKELSEFYKVGFKSAINQAVYIQNKSMRNNRIDLIESEYKLTKAPQSWCYIEGE